MTATDVYRTSDKAEADRRRDRGSLGIRLETAASQLVKG
jgi:hypothetical protein